jgi:hypothetical protein
MLNPIIVSSAAVLVLWACWCGFSRSVNDGIVGKGIYAAVAVAAMVMTTKPTNQEAHAVLIVAFALLGIRHYWLRYLKQRVTEWAATWHA